MTTTTTPEGAGEFPPLADMINDLVGLYAQTTQGVWRKGQTTHHTVIRREGELPYRIAEFRHANDAAFCDAAHAFMPALLAALRAQAAEGGKEKAATPCTRCAGSGMVDDGYLTHSAGGIRYENGPIKCVKDCPACKGEAAKAHTYASTQATNCAGCGKHKHTPLRIDAMGGYVCLTCIDQKLGSLLGEFGYTEAAEGEQSAAHAAAREAVAAALAVFPINLDGQSFRIGRDPLLQADGDDVFYSRKKANQIFQGLFDHLKGIESALAATPAPAHPLPVAGEEVQGDLRYRLRFELGLLLADVQDGIDHKDAARRLLGLIDEVPALFASAPEEQVVVAWLLKIDGDPRSLDFRKGEKLGCDQGDWTWHPLALAPHGASGREGQSS